MSTTSHCRLCGEPGVLVSRNNLTTCRECLKRKIGRLFARAFTRNVETEDVLALCCSGGFNSCLLLRLAHEYLAARPHRRGLHVIKVLILDESNVSGLTNAFVDQSGLQRAFGEVKEFASQFEWEVCVVPVEDWFGGDVARMNEFFSCLEDEDARQHVFSMIKQKLFLRAALAAGCSVVADGAIIESAAETAICTLVSGAGFGLFDKLSCTRVENGVRYVHPLCDVELKEAVVLCRMYSISPVFVPTFTFLLSSRRSVLTAVQELFHSMKQTHPSVATNVLRTAQKLALPPVEQRCVLCAAPTEDCAESKCRMCLLALAGPPDELTDLAVHGAASEDATA